jgi:hypothetical protein
MTQGDTLKILIIHGMPSSWLGERKTQRTVYNREFALLRYAPEHRYVLWCPATPPTTALRRQVREADAIILGTTLLCARWWRPRSIHEALVKSGSFIAEAPGRVIAFPQDDYYMNETLDDWFQAWNVDTVYTPLPEHASVLYPKTHKRASIKKAYTGYADDGDRILCSRWAKAWEMRTVDVSYRAKELPATYGKLGLQKSQIAHRFIQAVKEAGAELALDIEIGAGHTLYGTTWLTFLGNSKFVLGSPSGSSMLDPTGHIQDAITWYEQCNGHPPNYAYAEEHIFPGQDGLHIMGALGPRNIEAALAGCCQVLTASDQWTPMKAGEHFIELQPDCSNIEQVLAQMRDTDRVKQIIKNCADLFGQSAYSYGEFANLILEDISQKIEIQPRRLYGVDALLADYRMNNMIWDSEQAPSE